MQGNPRKTVDMISAALKNAPNDFVLGRLAEEYAAMCDEVSRRLDQCKTLLAGKDEFGAWRVAATPPDLLGLVEILAFVQADEWRDFCRARALPVPLEFDHGAVEKIEKLYSSENLKGMAQNHPLYAEYRKAVRLHDDESALQILSAIIRLNPSDSVSAKEHARLEQKQQRFLAAELARFLADGDKKGVLSTLEKIEQTPWKNPVEISLEKAKAIQFEARLAAARARARELLGKAASLAKTGAEKSAEPLYGEIETLSGEYDLDFSETERARLLALHSLLVRARELRAQKKRREETLETLVKFLAQEDSLPIGRARKITELEAAQNTLKRLWRELESASLPIPDDIALRARRAQENLTVDIARKRRNRYFAMGAAALVFTSALGAGAWWLHEEKATETFAAALGKFGENDSTAEAESLLAQAAANPSRANDVRVAPVLSKVREWLASQKRFYAEYAARRERVSAALRAVSPESTESVFGGAETAVAEWTAYFDALAVNYQREFAPEKIRVRAAWEEARHAWMKHNHERFQAGLLSLEKKISDAFKSTHLSEVCSAVNALRPEVESLRSSADMFAHRKELRRDEHARLEALEKTLKDSIAMSSVWRGINAEMSAADSREKWKEILEKTSALPAGNTTAVLAARTSLALLPKLTAEMLLKEALFPGSPAGIEVLRKEVETSVNPAAHPPSIPETVVYEAIQEAIPQKTQKNKTGEAEPVGALWRATILDAFGKTREIYTREAPTQVINTPREEQWKYEEFAGSKWEIKRTTARYSNKIMVFGEKVKSSRNVGGEIHFMRNFLGKESVDAGTGVLIRSPLEVLSRLYATPELSPLFTTYVEQELMKVISVRSKVWGTQFSLAFQRFEKTRKGIAGMPVHKWEWLGGSRAEAARAGELSELRKWRWPGYHMQILLKKELLATALNGNFYFAGYVGEDLRPRLTTAAKTKTGNLWSIDKKGNLWHGSARTNWEDANLQPLAPVFKFEHEGKSEVEILAAARSGRRQDLLPQNELPPLFQ